MAINHSIPAVAGVYAIVNTLNNKRYIGSSVNLKRRLGVHRSTLNVGTHHNQRLARAWEKYGESAFEVLILELVEDKSQVYAREQYHFDQAKEKYGLKQLYNLRPEVVVNGTGRQFSDETRRKISEAKKGKPHRPESIAKMKDAVDLRWRVLRAEREAKALLKVPYVASAEHRRKISQAKMGKPHSEATREKMRGRVVSAAARKKISEANTGRKHGPISEETRSKLALARKARKLGPLPPEHREKISLALKGKIKSNETKMKLSLAKKGKKHAPLSEDHKRKIGLSSKGRVMSDETRKKMSDARKKLVADGFMPSPESLAKRKATLKQKREQNAEEEKAWQQILHAKP